MTGKNLAAIALKVWGVVFLAGALMSLPQAILLWLQLPSAADQAQAIIRAQPTLMLLGPGARALIGVLLIAFADRIARRAIPETSALIIDAEVSDLTALAFAVAGVFVLVWGLQDVASVLFTVVTKPEFLSAISITQYAWGQQRVEIVRGVVEVAAAVVLILGRTGLASGWSRLRGRSAVEDADMQ